ncbi:hypothetical protein INR49_006976 [Caranx melampygus]|nr:hypothetical protein INR49_006976 [Caranx melampygus]
MEETVTEFQRQKLEDIKRIFSDFVTVEMLFHAKALEIYSHTHHNLQNMDIDKDLELFTGRLRSPDHLSRCLDSSSPLSGHYPSPAVTPPKLQSLRSTLAPPTGHRHSQATARRCRTLERQRGIEEEEEEEEEDDEEEDQHIIRQPYAAQFTQMHRWQK